MNEELEFVNLGNLANGRAAERFQQELALALENCLDLNTRWQTTRKVSLSVTMKMNEDRTKAHVEIDCKSSLGPVKREETTFFIDRQDGKAVAVEYNPKQMTLDEARRSEVVNFKTGEIK